MAILQCYVDDDTFRILHQAAIETGRKVAELAEAAIENAAIEYKVSRHGIGRMGAPPPRAKGGET